MRNNKILEALTSIRALQETTATDAQWLDEHNLKLGELKREHDEALAAARLLPVPEPTDIDTYDPTDHQVSINTGSFHLWTPAAQSEYLARKRAQVAKEQADLEFLECSMSDTMSAPPLLQLKEEEVSCQDNVCFGLASAVAFDARSDPYSCTTLPNTPSAPSSFPASAGIAAQTAYALEKYGEAGTNVAAGVLQQSG